MVLVSWFKYRMFNVYNLNSKVVVNMSREQYCLSSFLKLVSIRYINGL